MGGLVIIALMVVLFLLVISGLANEEEGGCIMNCANCPFPPCSEEEKTEKMQHLDTFIPGFDDKQESEKWFT